MFIVEFVSKSQTEGKTRLLFRVESSRTDLRETIKLARDLSRKDPMCAGAHYILILKANGVQEWLGLSEERTIVKATARQARRPSYRPARFAHAALASAANV